MGFIKSYFTELRILNEALENKHNRKEAHWEPPTKDQVKVNFDTVFQQQNNKVINGIIIRNNIGLIMGSCVYPVKNVRDPTTAEAYVFL